MTTVNKIGRGPGWKPVGPDGCAGSAETPARTLVVAESGVLRQLLRDHLEASAAVEVVAEAASGAAALECARHEQLELAVLVLSPLGASGLDLIRQARMLGLDVRFVVVAAASGGAVQEVLRAGAMAYLDPRSSADELLRAVAAVGRGEFYFSQGVTSDLARVVCDPEPEADSGLATLTHREREVLRLIAEGLSNREIAGQLRIAPRTVDGHRSKLMDKLDLHKASSLVRFAIREGLIAP